MYIVCIYIFIYHQIYTYICNVLRKLYEYVCNCHTCIVACYNFTNSNICSKVCSHMILPSPWHVVPSAVFDLSMKNQQK